VESDALDQAGDFLRSRACVQGLRHSSGIHFPMDGRPCVTHQEADFAEILLPGGVQVGSGVSQVQAAFWASIAGDEGVFG
jgi:hypothetical protein